jgi:hypothetical protein
LIAARKKNCRHKKERERNSSGIAQVTLVKSRLSQRFLCHLPLIPTRSLWPILLCSWWRQQQRQLYNKGTWTLNKKKKNKTIRSTWPFFVLFSLCYIAEL